MEQGTLHILLVEDDSGDVALTLHAFKASKMPHKFHVVDNGVKALQFLRREIPYEHVPRPDLIFLDLNLPQKNGTEVLEEIKTDASLKIIPVIMLTSSELADDVVRCYCLGANCYVTKPVGLAAFSNIMKTIEDFWFAIVKLPA